MTWYCLGRELVCVGDFVTINGDDRVIVWLTRGRLKQHFSLWFTDREAKVFACFGEQVYHMLHFPFVGSTKCAIIRRSLSISNMTLVSAFNL